MRSRRSLPPAGRQARIRLSQTSGLGGCSHGMRPAEERGSTSAADRVSGEAGFEEFFLENFPGVFRLLFRVTGSRQEAEDLAQEAFLRLLRRLRTEGDAVAPTDAVAPIAWTYRVALNLAYNRLRDTGRRRRRLEELGAVLSDPGARPGGPDESLLRERERDEVRFVLGLLPERQARLLLLRNSGLSYRQIAEVLEVAPGSIGTLLARAEGAFATRFREEFRDDEPFRAEREEKERRNGRT